MTPEFGLVCVTHGEDVRFRRMTRKRLLSLSEAEQRDALAALYDTNLDRLDAALRWCDRHDVRLYRLLSQLFPFTDTPLGIEVLAGFAARLRAAGRLAADLGIRVVAHPDPYVVLNSDDPAVRTNSVMILVAQALVMDALGLPRSPWATMEIHGGKRDRAEGLVAAIAALPDAVRARVALENDERAYGAAEILEVCRAAGVPMVFDAHHHLVREKLDSYDDPSIAAFTAAAATTWPDPTWQMVHISNGAAALHDPTHADLIVEFPAAFRDVPWVEIEARGKEVAIAALREAVG